MNQSILDPQDARLRSLLREATPTPQLPPRFQERVWDRIERTDAAPGRSSRGLDTLIAWLLRPRLALAVAAALVVAGAFLGVQHGTQEARHDAQMRYLAAVAPNPVR